MKDILAKKLKQTADGVWVVSEPTQGFGYTDGAWVERYLEGVFKKVSDLRSGSPELDEYIKDWNTEYHLTPKRKNLLDNLTYNPDHTVLEIGCGCGAITRFLGETFKQVVAVEGSYPRARLARMRTHDLPSVEVVNSRFQDLDPAIKFDAIFCIGVWEYSPSYVDGKTPFDTALDAMKAHLKPGGYLVLAIENQLGLKYFANSREDHAGRFFEGIEGYPRTKRKFETFGRKELADRLGSVGTSLSVYYPFPDYKIPDALLSEALFEKVNCGELIGSLAERDYAGTKPPFFNSRLAWPVIARNNLIPEVANSFLVVVGNDDKPSLGNALGYLYNTERRAAYRTVTTLEQHADGTVLAAKQLRHPGQPSRPNVAINAENSTWFHGDSIALALYRTLHDPSGSLNDALSDVRLWWAAIQAQAAADGMVPGAYIDHTWQNAVVIDGKVAFFDQEFQWHRPIRAKVLFLRAAFLWDARYRAGSLPHLRQSTARGRITALASALGIDVTSQDIQDVISLEADFQHEVGGRPHADLVRKISLQMKVPYLPRIQGQVATFQTNLRRAKNLGRRVFGAG
jgi:SAM-dependent methyltransferase